MSTRATPIKTVTATALRRALFKSLDDVLLGEALRVRTRRGDVVMLSEMAWKKIRSYKKESPFEPKISGTICSDLERADKELREFLRWPKAD